MNASKSEINDRVVAKAQDIEDMDNPADELDPLEFTVEADFDGRVKEIYAVLSTGGPKIELALFAGRVDGYWSSESHSAPIMDEETEGQLQAWGEFLRDKWVRNVKGFGGH